MIKELDCVNIVRKLRRLDYIVQALLTIPQGVLLKHQKRELLEEDTTSDEDSKKLFAKQPEVKNKENLDLFRALDYYKTKDDLNPVD